MLRSSGRHYGVRINLFTREKCFRLDRDQLVVIAANGTIERLRYTEVERLQLYRVNADNRGILCRCLIGGGGRKFLLQSAHFAGLARFEDRGATFRPFVRDLIREVSAASPTARFFAGLPFGLWLSWVVTLMMLIVMAFASIAVVLAGQWSSLVLIGMLLAGGPMAWTMVRNGRARRTNAQELLQDPLLRDGPA